ncbi:MAG: hypothetical protein ACREAC_23315, partial [Blastocatellia bacterium]
MGQRFELDAGRLVVGQLPEHRLSLPTRQAAEPRGTPGDSEGAHPPGGRKLTVCATLLANFSHFLSHSG